MEQRVGILITTNYLVIAGGSAPRTILKEFNPLPFESTEPGVQFSIASHPSTDTYFDITSLDYFSSPPNNIICQYNIDGDGVDSEYPCILIDTFQYDGSNCAELYSCLWRCLVVSQHLLKLLNSAPANEVMSRIRGSLQSPTKI